MANQMEEIMTAMMNNLKTMVDVNTIVGDAVNTPDGTVIIPIARVAFGFGTGGSEFGTAASTESGDAKFPFGGGGGAGVTVSPVAFMVVGKDMVRMIPVNQSSPVDKLLDYVPDLMDKVSNAFQSVQDKKSKKKEETGGIDWEE